MTTYRVHALTESGYLKPDGDCYAPQIMLTDVRYGNWNTMSLNARLLPIGAALLADAHNALNNDGELTARWARIVSGCNVIAVDSTGYSQGDYGTVFVFAPRQWLELTGAPGITPEDANDLSAWVWGDVYEVTPATHTPEGYGGFPGSRVCSCGATCCEEEPYDEDNSFYVYGMDAASKYGEIVFPTFHSYESYDD